MSNTIASSTPLAHASSKKGLRIALWTAQAILAAMFILAGTMKATTPIAELSQKMSVPTVLGEGMTRFIGVSELLGAVGLVLPALTRIKPVLTPIAAAALTLVMVLAVGYHASQGEYGGLPMNFFLGALAAFVAWGRFRAAPIAPRGGA